MPSSILNSDDGVISGTAGLKNSGGDDAVLLIQTKGVTAQTVDAGQRTMFPTTIGVGGATPSTSGSGISFPATQSASTNANTLDDYEEGTFSPVIAGAAAAGIGTYAIQVGRYTKIGARVCVDIHLSWSAHTGTGNMLIASLPFAANGASGYNVAAALVANNITLAASTYLTGAVSPGATAIELFDCDVGGGPFSSTGMDTSGQILCALTYEVN